MPTPLPEAARGNLDAVAGAGWTGRLAEASYKSPSGSVVRFDYEDVRRSVELRGSAYSFPGVNEQFVQRTGHGSRVYPMRCFFWGEQHDLAATAFEAALLESGRGRLTHPLYGSFDVVPFGSVARRDDLVTAANQSIVEVTFWTSLPSEYPGSGRDRRNELVRALDGFELAAADQFASDTNLRGAVDQANTRATIQGLIGATEDALGAVADATAASRAAFQDQVDLLGRGMDVLIGQPLVLARQIVQLVLAPGRAAAGIRNRLTAYGDFGRGIFQSARANDTVAPSLIGSVLTGIAAAERQRAVNDVVTSDLFGSSTVAGAALSTLETEFRTKPEAIAAAVDVTAQFDALVTWRDVALEGVGKVDTGASYQALDQVVQLVAGYLVEVSFTLVPERIVVLSRARTLVDLCAELYRAIDDDSLNFLISSNDLTGSEILELPAGKAIAYYVP